MKLNPESVISEIFAIGIRNPLDWYPESTLIWNLESNKVSNPELTYESILKPFAKKKIKNNNNNK